MSANLAAKYQGFSTFNKIDSSVWTLTGTSTFTGDVNVNAGTLVVNGDISHRPAWCHRQSGRHLVGTGTVPCNAARSMGRRLRRPLNGTGTLTVKDRVMFCDCVTLRREGVRALTAIALMLSPAVSVAVKPTLGGLARVTSPTGTYRFNSAYTILTAQGGLNGTTFDTLATPTGIGGVLSYTSNDVLLTLTSQLGQTAGLNGNQQRVANALDAGFNTGGNVGGLERDFQRQRSAESRAGLRRTRHRFAADGVSGDESVHGPDHRSVLGGAGRAEQWSDGVC